MKLMDIMCISPNYGFVVFKHVYLFMLPALLFNKFSHNICYLALGTDKHLGMLSLNNGLNKSAVSPTWQSLQPKDNICNWKTHCYITSAFANINYIGMDWDTIINMHMYVRDNLPTPG